MTQTVTVTLASIADLIEQRDALLEVAKAFKVEFDSGRDISEAMYSRVCAAIAKASPIAGLTEIGEEEVKNSTASQSDPVLTPKSAIGDAELKRRDEALEKADRALGETIDQRDAAEEALSQAYYLIMGRAADWSSSFGFSDALQDIDDAQHLLRAALRPQEGGN